LLDISNKYSVGNYVEIDLNKTECQLSLYDFESDYGLMILASGRRMVERIVEERIVGRTDSNGDIIRRLADNLGDIGQEFEQANSMRAYIVQSRHAENHA